MKNKNKRWVIVAFGIVALVLFIGVVYYGQPPEPEWQIGDRVYSPEHRAYGNVDDIYAPFDMINIRYDKGYSQQGSLSNPGIIKLNDSRYLEIVDFPIYPLSIPWQYVESFKSYHAHPPINDIQSYCIDVYGGYKDRFTCYSETDEEIVYFSVGVVDVTIWKLQKTLDNKTNINKPIAKTRKASQNYHNYTTINYSLLRDWLNYYGLKYNNQIVNPEDFDEIKNNTVFMSEYCSIYGYAGYDKKRGCYRVY